MKADRLHLQYLNLNLLYLACFVFSNLANSPNSRIDDVQAFGSSDCSPSLLSYRRPGVKDSGGSSRVVEVHGCRAGCGRVVRIAGDAVDSGGARGVDDGF